MKKLVALIFSVMLMVSVSATEIKLTSDNTAVLRSAFDGKSVTELKRELSRLDSKLESGYPIYLVLYTPGGSVQKGLELFEFIKGLNRPVHTVTIFAASMGFQAVQHLQKRYILEYGILMSHNAAGGARGEFNGAGKGQIASRLGLWYRRVGMMDEVAVKRTNGKHTLQSYQAAYSPELWLNGPEAVEQGFADEVAQVSCDESLNSQRVFKTFDFMFFSIKAVFSGCPLITSPLEVSASILTNKGDMPVKEFLLKNGKFGEKCNEKGKKAQKDYYGNVIPEVKSELCAYDKKLTIEKINQAVSEKEEFLNRSLRNSVERSY